MAKAEPTTKKAAGRAAGAKKADASKKSAAKAVSKAARAKKAATAKTEPTTKKAAPALKREVAKQPAKRTADAATSATTKPATTKPATTKPATTKKEPAKKEPAKKKEAPKKAAAKAEPVKPEPAKKEAAKKETASKAAAAKAEPVKKAVRKTTVICPLSGFEVKPDKPNLSPRTIDRLRAKLLEERARHMTQADALQAEAAQLALDREEGDTQFDEEGGEGDTVSVERERDLMLSASARQIVEEIDRALERIKNKTYGLCTPAGRRISVERLEALPYADTCVDCKARAERRR